MNPFFSIVIPCYNCAKLMQPGLASLKNQSFTNFEVVFVDDCSTDDTYFFLQDFCRQTGLRTRLVRAESNGGPGKAREIGISIATGRYIAFMDSDDWYEACFMEKIYERLSTGDYDILFFDYYRSYKSGKKKHIHCTYPLYKAKTIHEYVAMAGDSLCALVVKSEIIKKVSLPSLYNSEDAAVVPLLIGMSHKVTYVPAPFYNYLHREQSLSTSQNRNIYQGFIKAFDFIYENASTAFMEEVEYRGIHLVLYGALFKAIDAGIAKKEVERVIDDFEKKVPHWATNKYIKSLPLRKRVFLFLMRKRLFFLLRLYTLAQRFLLRLK